MQKSNKKNQVTAKKHLGQHFLNDEVIAFNIVKAFSDKNTCKQVLEIGPGMGVLTKYLLEHKSFSTYAIDIDRESIVWLRSNFPALEDRLIEGDFLSIDFKSIFSESFSLIGNFPYNISSQIIFKLIEHKETIPLMVGMFQKEVAERIGARPKNKSYGILSVLAQTYFDTEYLFTVPPEVFTPPPQVNSGVIRLIRKKTDFDIQEKMLFRVVKMAFNQRRKKLRNALLQFQIDDTLLEGSGFMHKRAEELSVEDFVVLTKLIMEHGRNNN